MGSLAPSTSHPTGRPRDARRAILDAGEELFAIQGFAATTIKQIGARAGLNTALLYYYFPNKLGLYRAVLGRIGTGLKQLAGPPLKQARTPEAVVRALIRGQTQLVLRHPRAAALLIRELLDYEASNAAPMIRSLATDLFRPVVAAINEGKERGSIRPDLNGELATISAIAQLMYFTLAKPLIRVLLEKGAEYPNQDDVRTFGRHAEEFAVAGMAPRTVATRDHRVAQRTERSRGRK